MSLLSDRELRAELARGGLRIQPTYGQPKTASFEMHLGRNFWMYVRTPAMVAIDPYEVNDKFFIQHIAGGIGQMVIYPQQFMLAHTVEEIELGRTLAARVDGKSSLGRLGLQVHCTAGFIDPGFKGQVTLELYNQAPFPILLRVGMPIGQLVCERTTGPVERPYGAADLASHYQGSVGAVLPRALERDTLVEVYDA